MTQQQNLHKWRVPVFNYSNASKRICPSDVWFNLFNRGTWILVTQDSDYEIRVRKIKIIFSKELKKYIIRLNNEGSMCATPFLSRNYYYYENCVIYLYYYYANCFELRCTKMELYLYREYNINKSRKFYWLQASCSSIN